MHIFKQHCSYFISCYLYLFSSLRRNLDVLIKQLGYIPCNSNFPIMRMSHVNISDFPFKIESLPVTWINSTNFSSEISGGSGSFSEKQTFRNTFSAPGGHPLELDHGFSPSGIFTVFMQNPACGEISWDGSSTPAESGLAASCSNCSNIFSASLGLAMVVQNTWNAQ